MGRRSQRRESPTLCGLEALEPRVLLAAFFVNTLSDTVDANPGDGVAVDASGDTSLRAAIMEANALEAASPGSDFYEIYLGHGTYQLTRSGSGEDDAATGDLDIKSTTYIYGANSSVTIIDALGNDRAFEVHPDYDANLNFVQIKGGQAPSGEMGGAVYSQVRSYLSVQSSLIIGNAASSGGGIASEGDLNLFDATIEDNRADNIGGGVYAAGFTSIYNTHVTGNQAGGNGGGIASMSSGYLDVHNGSVIDMNTAGVGASGGNGGGIYNVNSDLYLSESTVDHNTARANAADTAGGQGGGIFNVDGNLQITASTISNNTARRDGGGVWSSIQVVTENSFFLTNATISGNETERGNGAGLWVSEGGANILHATIVGNRANTQDIGTGARGGGLFIDNSVTSPTVQLDRSIVANNTRGTAAPAPDEILGAGVAGASAYNLISNAGTAGGLSNGVNGNIVGADPMLGPLTDNGGPTLTHHPMFGSAAIDAIDDDNQLSYYDQRDVFRNQDGDFDDNALADIGAVEVAYNYVDGGEGTVTVFGTDGNDLIEIRNGDGTVDITVNGNFYSYSSVDKIYVYGLKGADTLIVEAGLMASQTFGGHVAICFAGGPDFDTFSYDATGSSDILAETDFIRDFDRVNGTTLLYANMADVELFELFAGFQPGVGDDITIRDDVFFDAVVDLNPPVRGGGEVVSFGLPVAAAGTAVLGIESIDDTDNLIFIYEDEVQFVNAGKSVMFYNDSGALESLEIYSGPGDDNIQVLTDLLPPVYIDAGDPSASDTVSFFGSALADTFDLYDWFVDHNGHLAQLVNVEHVQIDIASAGTDVVNANQSFFGALADVEVFGDSDDDTLNVFSSDADQYGRVFGTDVFLDETGPGNLRFVDAIFEGGVDENSGLAEVTSAAVSPDGGWVFAVSSFDDSISVFDRDHIGGGLNELYTLYDGNFDGAEGLIQGLRGAQHILLSPDGRHAYVSSATDDAIAVFSVYDSDLYITQALFDSGVDGEGNAVSGLDGSNHAAMSPDGHFLYAAGYFDNAVTVFERNVSTGELTVVETLVDGGIDNDENIIDGLNGPTFVLVSGDGKFVYVASDDDSSIAVFSRNETTGELLFVEVLTDGGVDGMGNTIDGLANASSLAMTPDGMYLYASSPSDNAVARFERDAMTGELTFLDAIFDGGTDFVGNTINGLGGARPINISPDGRWLYAGGVADGGIAVFAVVFNGNLNYRGFVQDNNFDGFGNPVDGIAGLTQFAFDPTGRHVYVPGRADNAIATFALPRSIHVLHSGLTDLNVTTGEGFDQVDVNAGGLPSHVHVNMGDPMSPGSDIGQVFGTNAGDVFDVLADQINVGGSAIHFAGQETLNLDARAGNDVVKVHDGANVDRADGGSEFDVLDYSMFAGPASVDLPGNMATGFGGVFNFESVVPPIAFVETGSLLEMVGTANADDVIISMPSPGVLRVRIPAFSFDQTFNGEMGEGVTGVIFNAGDGDDSLTVDYTDGDLILPDDVQFDGQTQDADGDTLFITGNAAPFSSVTYEYGGQDAEGNDGSVRIDDGAQTLNIIYDGLEPITNDGTTTDIVFNLPRGVNNSDIMLAYNAGSGLMELTGSTFEDTFFVMPTAAGASVTITLGNQSNAIVIDSVDPAFIGTLDIIGGPGSDKLTGPDSSNTWTLDGLHSGSFVDGFEFTFDDIDVLMGGAMDDTFLFLEGVNFGGMLIGGGGSDTLDYSAFNGPAIVNLGGGTATGTTGVSGVESVVLPTDFTVINTNDSGFGSLRNAILGANLAPGAATITFAIPTSDPGHIDVDDSTPLPGADPSKDVWVINPTAPLPALNNAGGFGISIDGDSQAVFIGSETNPNGPEIVLNGAGVSAAGLSVQSAGHTIHGLVIQQFGGAGIDIFAGNTSVTGNYIGTNATATAAIANAAGVAINNASGNAIGGVGAGEANIISGNTQSGVVVSGASAAGNTIRGNSIFDNGALGIDLGSDGPTANDTLDIDAGANGLQNFPVVLGADSDSDVVAFELHGAANTLYTIDFYANDAADPSGFGEGQFYLGSTTVSTQPDGSAVVNGVSVGDFAEGQFITATATDPSGNTSEFAMVVEAIDPVIQVDDAVIITGTGHDDQIIISSPTSGAIRVQIINLSVDEVLTGVSSVSIDTLEGDDSVTLDYSEGDIVLSGGLTYNGGTQSSLGDVLNIGGNATPFVSNTYNYAGQGPDGFNGSIAINNGAQTTAINYTGLEPIVNSGSVTDIVFNLPNISGTPNEGVQFRNAGTPGLTELAGATFENTSFASPSNLVRIFLGDEGDSIQIVDADASFAATLEIIGGGGGDQVVGQTLATNWFLTGAGQGTSNSASTGAVPFLFSNIESLVGGNNNDFFAFAVDVDFGGDITGDMGPGNPGFDTLDYRNYTTDPQVDLVNGTATGTTGISSIEDVLANANHWLGGDGSFDDATMWSLGVVPNADDHALIDADGDYVVYLFFDDASVDALTVGGVTGTQVFNVGSVTFNVAKDALIGAGDELYGTYATLQFDGDLSIEGTLTLDEAVDTLEGEGLATIEVGGELVLISSNSTIDIDNFGTLTATGFSSLSGAFTSEPMSMIVIDSGLVSYVNSTQVHFIDGLTNHGTLEITNSDGEANPDADATLLLGFGSGVFTNASDGVVDVRAGDGGGPRTITGQVDNQGNLNLIDTDLSVDGGEAGDMMNGGTIDIGAELELTFNSPLGSLRSSGMVNAAGGAITLFTTAGIMEVSGGTTTLGILNGDLEITGGTVKGNGTVNGTVTNGGTLAPGSSPGTFMIDGDYQQTSTGVLAIEIDSLASFDQLQITGEANLGGTLSVTQNFTPSDGDTFTVLTYGSLMNDFATFTGIDIVPPFFRLEPSPDVMQYDLIATDLTPASDLAPPSVSLTAGNVTTAGVMAHPLTLDITDVDSGVDTDTLDNTDLVVMLPGGGFQSVSFSSFVDNDGSITGNYLFSPPGGSWGIEDNGTYTVMLIDGEIGDLAMPPNFASAATLGTFQVNIPDTTKPTGSLVMPVGSPTFGSTAFTFSVTFTDNVLLDASSILNHNDVIFIDGPGALDGGATFVSATPNVNANSITATYSFAAPGGVWDAGATGTYTVQVVGGSVDDTSANSINAANLGNFSFSGGNTFLVINTADAGGGSLRRAITASNAHSAAATIQFAIPTSDPGFASVGAGANGYTINLLSPLPAMNNALGVNLNGSSQSGNPNPFGPDVVLNGASAGGSGLMLMSSHNTVQGLVIRSFSGAGVEIYGDSNHVMNNFIGASPLGSAAQGNAGGGVVVYGASNTIGGAAASDANVISGNSVGVVISGEGATGNTLFRNLIGVDRTGEVDLGNSGFGVLIEDGASANVVGSAVNANVISGNNSGGVKIVGFGSDSNSIVGNLIGVDDDGVQPIGNTGPGVLITDGAGGNAISGNVIGANSAAGVQISPFTGGFLASSELTIEEVLVGPSFGNSVLGNAIGTDRAQALNLGNGGAGVLMTDLAEQNMIGGVSGSQPNVIAHNSGGGVLVATSAGVQNTIRGNSIYANNGLGIDLGAVGPTANDAQDPDAEENPGLEIPGFANTLQNFPVITDVEAGSTIVSGTLNSMPLSTFTIDFYLNDAPDPSGFGEGRQYLGSTVVVTDGNGDAAFNNIVFAATVLDGQYVTATATDADGNTSEFSAAFEADLIIDTALPTAVLTLANTVFAPGTQQQIIEVTYSDDIALDPTSFDVSDITVTGPGGPLNVASAIVLNNTPGTPRVVRYLVDPPGGSWDQSDNGSYTVALNVGAVRDTSNKGNLPATLGSFVAALPPPPDPQDPTATLIPMNVTTPGQAFVEFMVTYSDNAAINVATLGANDVLVQTPGGATLPVTFVGVDNNTDGSPRKATYRFDAPGDGVFDVADNGTYTVIMVVGAVTDTGGNDVPAGALGTFQVALADTIAPVAAAAAADLTVGGGLTYQFTVTYSDNTAINAGTLDDNDIVVRLPDGVTLLPARLVSVNLPGNGSPRTATYEIDAPRSPIGFGSPDDGTYTIEVVANQVFDTASTPSAVAPGAIGTFAVNLAGQPTVELVGGTLFIVGTENPDNIAVMAMGDGIVQVTIQPAGFSQKYAGVTDVNVMGLAGDDVITLDAGATAADGTPMAGYYEGGEGDDIINAGPGDDTILLGPGDDTVNGGAGEDTVLAVGEGGGFDMIRLTGPRLAIFNGDTIALGSDIEKVDIDFTQDGNQSALVDASFLIDAINYMGGPAQVGSTDTLSINDDLGVAQSITVGDNVVNVSGGGNPQTIMMSGLTALNITTGGGADVVTIPTTAAGIPPLISLSTGGGAAGDDVRVEGSSNNDLFAVHPASVDVSGVTVNLTPGFDLTLAGLGGDDTYQLFDGWYSHMIDEGAGEGAGDTLDGSNVTGSIDFNIGSVTATSGGSVSSHAQSNIEHLIGGSNNDNFILADGASVAGGLGTINGGPGTDTLDYTAYTTPVFADLGTGMGTGVSSFTSIENLEGVGPVATLAVEDIMQAGGDIHLLTVTYTGAGSPIVFSSIGDGDLTIVGPGDVMFEAEFIGIDLLANGDVRVATYALRASGLLGSEFDETDNGTYHVLLNTNQVFDTNGNSAKAGELGTFDIAINGARPVATTDPANIGFPGTTYLFDVVYTDADGLVDTDTLGHDDILVTSSANGGFAQYATFVDADISADGSTVVATYRLIAPGGLWTADDNGVYQIHLAGDVADDEGNLAAKTLVGLFRVKIAPGDSEVASNLVGQLGSLPPDAIVRPGDKGSVDLKIMNQGPDPVDQIITIELFASHDSEIGEGDIPIGQTTKRIKLNVGQMVSVRVNFELPNDLPFGDYQIIALMDTTDAVPGESLPIATDDMITVDNRFGNVDGKRARLTLRDNDGTLVTFTLSGDGTGMVEQTPQGFNVIVDGASSNTSVNITARGGNGKANLNDIIVNGQIKSFKATKSIVKGDVTFSNSVKTLGLDIVDANHVITIGAPANPGDTVTISASEWTDTSLLSQTAIRSLKLKKWTDANATPDVLEAPAAGTIKIGEVVGVDMTVDGEVKAVDVNNWSTGDLTADTLGKLNDKGDLDITLRLVGPAPGNGKTLGNTRVKGAVAGKWIIEDGNTGTITVGSAAPGFSASIAGAAGNFTSKGDFDGVLAAAAFNKVTIQGNTTQARVLAGANLGADGMLGGGDDSFVAGDLSFLRVKGNALSSIFAAGLNPVDGIFNNGDDTLAAPSAIGNVLIDGTLSGDSLIAAATLPAVVKVNGANVTTSTDPRFRSV